MIQTIKESLICALLLVGVVIGVKVIQVAIKVEAVIDSAKTTVDKIPAILLSEGTNARKDLAREIHPISKAAVNALKDSSKSLNSAALGIAKASESIAELGPKIGNAADALAGVPKQLRPILKSANKAAGNIADITGSVSDALPMFTDCDHNEDCVFNRYQGVSKAVEEMLIAWAKAAPEMTQHVLGISGSADAIALAAKQTAYELTRHRTAKEKMTNLFYGAAPVAIRIAALFL